MAISHWQFWQFIAHPIGASFVGSATTAVIWEMDMAAKIIDTSEPKLFLTEGGPFYRCEVRMRLINTRRSDPFPLIILIGLLTWFLLFCLAAAEGLAFGHAVRIPFIRDFAVHARFLVAVPLLLLSEKFMGTRLERSASHLLESGLVSPKDTDRYRAAVQSGLRWRDSALAESLLLVAAYASTVINFLFTAVHVSTWYAERSAGHISFTLAGWWLILFCIPLFQFLTLRWVWRLFLWAKFLWRISSLHLRLTATHPDQAGGLGGVGEAQRLFGIVLFAYSAAVAGVMANTILYEGHSLIGLAPTIAIYVAIAVGIVLLPLFCFIKILMKAKWAGLHQYGALAHEYTAAFHDKWIVRPAETKDELLGSADIQSLADLGNSFSFVERMNALPMSPRTPIHLMLACLIPMAPLLFTVFPPDQLLKMVLKVLI